MNRAPVDEQRRPATLDSMRRLALLLLTALCGCGSPATPPPSNLDLVPVRLDGESFSRRLLASSLQGLVNRDRPRLFLLNGEPELKNRWWEEIGESTSERFWLAWYADRYHAVVEEETSLDAVLGTYGREVAGYVLASEEEPWTLASATTLAGLDRLLVATEETAPTLDALRVPRREDLRGRWSSNDACIRDGLSSLWPRTAGTALGVVAPDEYRLRDWLVARGIFTVFARPGGDGWAALIDVLNKTPSAIPVEGYVALTGKEELESVRAISASGKWLIPADTTSNLSVHSGVRASIPARPAAAPIDCSPSRLRVALAFTDGDNLAVPLNRYVTARGWPSPERGSLRVGWGLSPSLATLAPGVAARFAEQASDADELVAMLGVGYAYPSLMPDRGPFVRQTLDLMQRLGWRTLWLLDGSLADAQAPAWQDFSAGYTSGALDGCLLGYGSRVRGAVRTSRGMPVLTAGGRYGDSPEGIESQIRADLAAWRGGGPSVVFVIATAWSVDLGDLAAVRKRLAGEPDVEFVSPGQALACLGTR